MTKSRETMDRLNGCLGFRLKGCNYGGAPWDGADARARIAGGAGRFALIPIAAALFLKTKNWDALLSLSIRPKPRIRRGWQYAGGDDVWRQRSIGHWWASNCGQ